MFLSRSKFLDNTLLILSLVLASALLLVLGSDEIDHVRVRMFLGILIILLSALLLRTQTLKVVHSLSFWVFAAMIGFILLRALWGFVQLAGLSSAEGYLTQELYKRYVHAPILWIFYFAFFIFGYVFFDMKSKTSKLMEVLAWTSGFIALNGIPSLFQHPGKAFYSLPDASMVFFHPLFYFHPLVKKYILGTFAHPNYTGDVIAIGFFAAIGLALYVLIQFFMRTEDDAAPQHSPLSYIILRAMLAVTIAIAIFLFFSRGTMAVFLLSLGVYFLFFVIKFPSKFTGSAVLGMAILIFICLAWGANLKGAWKELQTLGMEQEALKKEESLFQSYENQSSRYVREGIRRCLLIQKAYPLWGAGSRGYRAVAQHYADPEKGMIDPLLNLQSLCYYMQLLAEEGMGAFIYFLFFIVYGFEVIWGMFRTQSRFKFIAALSLFMPVAMILMHAAFNQLMDQFSMTLLVSMMMGASLAVLRPDFKREPVS